jgi:dCTP deaminase
MAPHSFLLGKTFEYFNMPKDVVAIAVGKSTYARAGIIINVTPIEPGWCGEIVIEISNTTDSNVIIYPGEGIMQLMFFMFNTPPDKDYTDLGGKYQNQKGVTLPKT